MKLENKKNPDEMIHDIDKRVAVMSTDIKYMKKNAQDQSEVLRDVQQAIQNIKTVTPEAFAEYVREHNQQIDDHEHRIEKVEKYIENEQTSFWNKFRASLEKRTVEILVIVIVAMVCIIIIKIGNNSADVPRMLL